MRDFPLTWNRSYSSVRLLVQMHYFPKWQRLIVNSSNVFQIARVHSLFHISYPNSSQVLDILQSHSRLYFFYVLNGRGWFLRSPGLGLCLSTKWISVLWANLLGFCPIIILWHLENSKLHHIHMPKLKIQEKENDHYHKLKHKYFQTWW